MNLMNNNIDKLEPIISIELNKLKMNDFIKKRIIKELLELKNKNAYISVEYNKYYKNQINPYIAITIIHGKKNYQFHIGRDYPSRPPKKFTINYKNYLYYLEVKSRKTLQELREIKKIKCLCCDILLYGNKWSNTYGLIDYIDEFNKLMEYRREIIYNLLTKKIISKYLISDINLMQWIF